MTAQRDGKDRKKVRNLDKGNDGGYGRRQMLKNVIVRIFFEANTCKKRKTTYLCTVKKQIFIHQLKPKSLMVNNKAQKNR